MLIDTDNLEKGCIYSIGVDGRLWRYFPRINLPLAKKINITTGEIIYPTNADRIRNMTDEELAQWIHQTRHNPLEDRNYWEWLKWLKQEVSK